MKMNRIPLKSAVAMSFACFLLLISASIPTWAGQALINIIDAGQPSGQPSWVAVCMSNGYHTIEVEGSTSRILAKPFTTNLFFVLQVEPVDSATVELEAVDAITGITMYLERFDTGKLTLKRMSAFLHAIEDEGAKGKGWDEIITLTISEWRGASREQNDLTFAFRQTLAQGKDVRATALKPLRMYVAGLQDMVRAKHLPVPFAVSGGMFPACYVLKPTPIPRQSLYYGVVDLMTGLSVDTITIKDKKDIPSAIQKIRTLWQGKARTMPADGPSSGKGRGE